MLYLILDTNIWMYIAEGEHPDITQFIIEKINADDIELLANEVIITEWERHKAKSKEIGIKKVKDQIAGATGSTKAIRKALTEEDKLVYDTLLNKFKQTEASAIQKVNERIDRIDDLLHNRSKKTEVNDAIKLAVIEFGLQKRAPFHNKKNNIADALILLSTLKYLREDHAGLETPNAIFITNNIEDFSEGLQGEAANRLHPQIIELLGGFHLTFKRNAGEVLNLAPQYIEEINRFWDHIHDMVVQEMEMQAEIMRGK